MCEHPLTSRFERIARKFLVQMWRSCLKRGKWLLGKRWTIFRSAQISNQYVRLLWFGINETVKNVFICQHYPSSANIDNVLTTKKFMIRVSYLNQWTIYANQATGLNILDMRLSLKFVTSMKSDRIPEQVQHMFTIRDKYRQLIVSYGEMNETDAWPDHEKDNTGRGTTQKVQDNRSSWELYER